MAVNLVAEARAGVAGLPKLSDYWLAGVMLPVWQQCVRQIRDLLAARMIRLRKRSDCRLVANLEPDFTGKHAD